MPTALKAARGTINTGRQNEREPKLPLRIPSCPDHLSDQEREAWAYFAGLLEPMEVVAETDAAALEMLVVAFVLHKRLAESLRDGSLTYVTESGMRRTRPELAALRDAERRLLVLLGRFGLTPSDRQRVSTSCDDESPDETPFDEFA